MSRYKMLFVLVFGISTVYNYHYSHNSKKNFIKNLKKTSNEGPVHELYLCFRWLPVFVDKEQKLALMSIGFLVENEQDAIIWRGPKKTGVKHLDHRGA